MKQFCCNFIWVSVEKRFFPSSWWWQEGGRAEGLRDGRGESCPKWAAISGSPTTDLVQEEHVELKPRQSRGPKQLLIWPRHDGGG